MSTPHRIQYDLYNTKYTGLDPGDSKDLLVGGRSFTHFPITTTASLGARTLPVPDKAGVFCTVVLFVDGGTDLTLTVTSGFEAAGTAAIVLGDAGDFVTLMSIETAAGTFRWRVIAADGISGVPNLSGGNQTLMIDVTDATTYTILAANSGKVHIMPNLTADIVMTLPTAAAGLSYEFWYKGVAADAQDWQFDTGSDTNFFLGGFVELDPSGNTVVAEAPDGNSNSKCNILTPGVGTVVKLYCDGTNWILSGTVQSDTLDAVTWADQ